MRYEDDTGNLKCLNIISKSFMAIEMQIHQIIRALCCYSSIYVKCVKIIANTYKLKNVNNLKTNPNINFAFW